MVILTSGRASRRPRSSILNSLMTPVKSLRFYHRVCGYPRSATCWHHTQVMNCSFFSSKNNLLVIFHGKNGSFTFCPRDKFVSTQKLARVLQTTLTALMVRESLCELRVRHFTSEFHRILWRKKRFAVTKEASLDNRGCTVVGDCFPQKLPWMPEVFLSLSDGILRSVFLFRRSEREKRLAARVLKSKSWTIHVCGVV